MKEKDTKQYTENGSNYKFNFEELCKSFSQMQRKRGKECTVQQLEEEIGSEVNVSPSTIHTWRNGNSAPNSIEVIKDLAIALKIEDYHDLLKKERSVNTMAIDYDLETKRMEALDIIYNRIFEFLQEFRDQDGYLQLQEVTSNPDALDGIISNPYPTDNKAINELRNIEMCGCSFNQDIFNVIEFIIYNKVFDIKLMFERTAVPLQETEIYTALKDYINTDFVKFVYDFYDFWCHKDGCYERYFEVVEKLQKIISEKVLN